MNKENPDKFAILRKIGEKPYSTQRDIAKINPSWEK